MRRWSYISKKGKEKEKACSGPAECISCQNICFLTTAPLKCNKYRNRGTFFQVNGIHLCEQCQLVQSDTNNDHNKSQNKYDWAKEDLATNQSEMRMGTATVQSDERPVSSVPKSTCLTVCQIVGLPFFKCSAAPTAQEQHKNMVEAIMPCRPSVGWWEGASSCRPITHTQHWLMILGLYTVHCHHSWILWYNLCNVISHF